MHPWAEICLVIFAMATVSRGCSPPEGGFIDPTEAEKVHYSGHVVVGTVRKLIYPDPFYQDMYQNETYGAIVQVRCSYKGPTLGDTITIHGAGYVPGHCTSKELKSKQEYIIFLRQKEPDVFTYEQTYPAEKFSQSAIDKYRNVCGLDMRYPEEGGMMLRRKTCPATEKLSNCQRYVDGVNKEAKKPRVASVEVRLGATNDTTTRAPGDSAATSATSLALIALCSILGRLL